MLIPHDMNHAAGMVTSFCLRTAPEELFWLHAGSDILIALAYHWFPIILGYVFWKRGRNRTPAPGVVVGLALFVLACGWTHIFNTVPAIVPDAWVWTAYWAAGWIKMLTAVASLGTAFLLTYIARDLIQLRTPTEEHEYTKELELEIERLLRVTQIDPKLAGVVSRLQVLAGKLKTDRLHDNS